MIKGEWRPRWPCPTSPWRLRHQPASRPNSKSCWLEQQTPGSPNYHHWLTPEEYGQRFGVSDADLGKITQWLQEQGLQVTSVARGRNWIVASGTAAQVETAFQTEIHTYLVDGETHFRERIGAVRTCGVCLSSEKHSRPERFPHEAEGAPLAFQAS